MNTYPITITETLQRKVFVEAESEAEAFEIIEREHKDEKHVLDSGDFIEVSFSIEAAKPEAGICPVCESDNLQYGTLELQDESVYYPWDCNSCDASGKEYNKLLFDEHVVD
jgi:hypothetical protein